MSWCKKCPKCHKLIPIDGQACPDCGEPVPDEDPNVLVWLDD